jgi:hypothetical protein
MEASEVLGCSDGISGATGSVTGEEGLEGLVDRRLGKASAKRVPVDEIDRAAVWGQYLLRPERPACLPYSGNHRNTATKNHHDSHLGKGELSGGRSPFLMFLGSEPFLPGASHEPCGIWPCPISS